MASATSPRLRAAARAILPAGLALVSAASALAADVEAPTELDAVIVTAPSADGTVRTAPHGVSVITAEDIARSTATFVGDLLSREANVNLQSFFGTDKNSTIDIRGMGATASSNVLILVDGLRLNENDLSAPDLSTVPLAQIERIEIVRGGGAVRYGSGAVGGVVNIVTRRARPGPPQVDVQAQYGSYATTDLRAAVRGAAGPLLGTFTASRFDTDGYRENGDVAARDWSGELRLQPSGRLDFIDLYVRAADHRDTSGLPGPVSATAFAAGEAERRASRFPFDESSTRDQRRSAGAYLDFGRAGQIEVQAGKRDRENPYVIGFNPLIPRAQQESEIQAERNDYVLRYDLPFRAIDREHTVELGVDGYDADYLRRENGEQVLGNSTRRQGTAESRGRYAALRVRGPAALTFNGGARFDRFSTRTADSRYTRGDCRTVFDTVLVDVLPGPGTILVPIQVPRQTGCVDAYRVQGTQGGDWKNRGLELGLTWQPTRLLTAFAGYTENFRNPNVDELLLAASDLRPQTGRTLETGVRLRIGTEAEVAATLFRMDVDDEIYFGLDPRTGSGLNRNYDEPTRRTGGEFEARWRAARAIALRTSLGYVRPQFGGTGADIPLVPRVTAAAELEWALTGWMRTGVSARHVGSRYDGNDFTNDRYPRLPAYTVVDAVLRVDHRGVQLAAGVNNLFDEVYSTIAYSNTFYPMPGRNYYVSLRARF